MADKTIRNTGVVNASPQAVMVWWFHPDRRQEFRDRIERSGGRDVSVVASMEGDLTVTTTTFVNKGGHQVRERQERRLTSEGTAPPNGSRFIAESTEVMTREGPGGHEATRTCQGRMEFVPRPDGSTEVISLHKHVVTGGTFGGRLRYRRVDPAVQSRQFAEMIELCRAALTEN